MNTKKDFFATHEVIARADDYEKVKEIISRFGIWETPDSSCIKASGGKLERFKTCSFKTSREVFESIMEQVKTVTADAEMYTLIQPKGENPIGVRTFERIVSVKLPLSLTKIFLRLKRDDCPKESLPVYIQEIDKDIVALFKVVKADENWKKNVNALERLAYFINHKPCVVHHVGAVTGEFVFF